MSYQQTSYAAWESVQEGLSDKQKVVLWAFRSQGDMTNEELSKFLNWEINRITPRSGELVKKGLLEAKDLKIGPTGRRATAWGCTEKGMQ